MSYAVTSGLKKRMANGKPLAPESRTRRDFNVVTKLEVPDEFYSGTDSFHGERFENLYSGHLAALNVVSWDSNYHVYHWVPGC